MSCENYNPIAAAAAAPHIPDGTSIPYASALVGQRCWCCEMGSIYSVFGGIEPPGGLEPICDTSKHLVIIDP